MSETLPLTEAKARLSELVERISTQQERVVITRHGRPSAVIVSPEDLESLEETLAILSDPQLMASIREAEAERAAGRPPVPVDDIKAELGLE